MQWLSFFLLRACDEVFVAAQGFSRCIKARMPPGDQMLRVVDLYTILGCLLLRHKFGIYRDANDQTTHITAFIRSNNNNMDEDTLYPDSGVYAEITYTPWGSKENLIVYLTQFGVLLFLIIMGIICCCCCYYTRHPESSDERDLEYEEGGGARQGRDEFGLPRTGIRLGPLGRRNHRTSWRLSQMMQRAPVREEVREEERLQEGIPMQDAPVGLWR